MKIKIQSTIFILLGCAVISCIAAEEKHPESLKKIHEKAQKHLSEGQSSLEIISSDFQVALSTVDLSPSDDFAETASALHGISTTLLNSLGKRGMNASDSEVGAVGGATRTLLKKLDETIDENYQFQIGTANVSPPPGVPNAAAGMDPNGISDPVLKKKYLESIAKEKEKANKNNQQRELQRIRRIVIIHIVSLRSGAPNDKLDEDEIIKKFTEDGISRKSLMKILSPESGEK